MDGLDGSEACRLRQLDDKITRPKKLLADAMLDNALLKDNRLKKMVTPAGGRDAVFVAREAHGISAPRAVLAELGIITPADLGNFRGFDTERRYAGDLAEGSAARIGRRQANAAGSVIAGFVYV